MIERRRPRFSYSNVAATLAVVLALSSPAWSDPVAHTGASAGGNVKKALKLSKQADKRSKRALRTANRALAKGGPAGQNGAPGAGGAQGPAGTAVAYAHVLVNGTLDQANSKNVVSAVKLAGTGQYCLDTSVPVHVAVGDITSIDTNGVVRVNPNNGSANPFCDGTKTYVETRTNTNAFEDDEFFVIWD